MLQSIQYGNGVPTYIYSNNPTSGNNGYMHVYASQMTADDKRREEQNVKKTKKREKTLEEKEKYLRDSYERGYREQDLAKWL